MDSATETSHPHVIRARRLYTITNVGLGQVVVNGEHRLHHGDTLTIVQRLQPQIAGVGFWAVQVDQESRLAEDWERGHMIRKAVR